MRKSAGFTLIELIIVTFVVAIVAAALIANFRSGEKQKRVNLSRDTIITALRTAQNYSLSGKQIPPPGQATEVRGSSRCANNSAAVSYWVEFPSSGTTFSIMAEDTCGAIINVQSYSLVQRTMFSSTAPYTLDTGSGASNRTSLAVRFLPPFGNMTATATANPLANNFAAFTTGTVNISFTDGTRPLTVTIDGISGRIQ